MEKIDFKAQQKALYLPGDTPSLVAVPGFTFMMVDGRGDPNAESGAYAEAVGLLYALTYAIKMNKTGAGAPPDYFDYVVPPLEGLWSYDDGGPFRYGGKEHFVWTSMIRQPGFVTPAVFENACRTVQRKKPDYDVKKARLAVFEEGLCVQCMHRGPFDTEPATVEKMDAFMLENGIEKDFSAVRRHHEIYLGDPRKTAPEKLRTVIRHPVKKPVSER